jgi:hypothetical protein
LFVIDVVVDVADESHNFNRNPVAVDEKPSDRILSRPEEPARCLVYDGNLARIRGIQTREISAAENGHAEGLKRFR